MTLFFVHFYKITSLIYELFAIYIFDCREFTLSCERFTQFYIKNMEPQVEGRKETQFTLEEVTWRRSSVRLESLIPLVEIGIEKAINSTKSCPINGIGH